MIPNIMQLAHDEAFIESQHPRDQGGKFSAGGGNGGQAPQPAQVSSTLTGIFKAGGFKKVKKTGPNGEAIYAHPSSGVHVKVHPAPAGKKWSSKWTSSKGGNTDVSGEGSSLAKLLRVAVEKAQAKKAEAATPTATPSAAPVKSSDLDLSGASSYHEAVDALDEEGYSPAGVSDDGDYSFFNYDDENDESQIMAFNNKTKLGYFVDNYHAPKNVGAPKGWSQAETAASAPVSALTPTGNTNDLTTEAEKSGYNAVVDYLKGKDYTFLGPAGETSGAFGTPAGAKVMMDYKTGDWVASTPGHMTKEGKGAQTLQALFSGKIEPGVKNSQQVVQTNTEKAYAAEMAKQSQEKAKVSNAKAHAANAQYNKMKEYAAHPTAQQQTAISKYSGSAYNALNEQLRHNQETGHNNKTVKDLDSYLMNSTIPETVTVRRGVSGEYAKILKSIIFEGTKFIDRGFVSTSAKEGWDWGSGMTFEIEVPAGSKGAAIGKWSHHSHEMEVLLPRGSAFVVTHYDPKNNLVKVRLDQDHLK